MKLLNNKTQFIEWVLKNDVERGLSKNDYELLYNYLDGHGYAICVDSEDFIYRVDVEDEGTISYSIDELIMDVATWNSNMIQECGISIKVVPNVVDIVQIRESLKEHEKVIDRLYLTTKTGKLIQSACRRIVEEGV